MTGYNANDMATQGADGFRDGYKAGYADAKTAAPGIDLEQFREAVVAWSDAAYTHSEDSDHPVCREADRLLALIDASPKGGSDALLREVCEQLEAVGCGACAGSMAPMEDLHGRIVEHLSMQAASHGAGVSDA